MSTLRLLVRPALFTAGVCGTCFCGAAIIQYENKRRSFPAVQDWIQVQKRRADGYKYSKIRQQINSWANRLTVGDKIAGGTIFINLLVLCAWRVNGIRPVMKKYFLSQVSSSKIPLTPMVLSCFSHTMPLHFAFNMYALYSFSNFATSLLGPEQLIGLFLSAGAVSSFTSVAQRLVTKRTIPSLGASGALLGVIAYICCVKPDTNLLLFFIPITAGNAIKALMAVDTVGLVAGWQFMDHAAHLGGSLFGVWYALQGEKLFYKYRKDIIEKWSQLKDRYD